MIPIAAEELISVERVRVLHQRALLEHGGLNSNEKDGCVDGTIYSSVAASYYEPMGDGLDGDSLTFAVHLFYGLCKKHCFSDGNKRAAWAAVVDVFARMGLAVNATHDEAVTFSLDVAASEASQHTETIRRIFDWFLEDGRLVELPDPPLS